jgi:hypothetical protein
MHSVVMLRVLILGVDIEIVIMLSVNMLLAVMLTVVMPLVVMLRTRNTNLRGRLSAVDLTMRIA